MFGFCAEIQGRGLTKKKSNRRGRESYLDISHAIIGVALRVKSPVGAYSVR